MRYFTNLSNEELANQAMDHAARLDSRANVKLTVSKLLEELAMRLDELDLALEDINRISRGNYQ
jgi:hypothetical protein